MYFLVQLDVFDKHMMPNVESPMQDAPYPGFAETSQKGSINVAVGSDMCVQRHLLTRDNVSWFPASDSI